MRHHSPRRLVTAGAVLAVAALALASQQLTARTAKPVLHGSHWMAITGKPLAATAGAITFQRGGNAVDAAAAMLAATCTMWDTLAWGGETQALIWNPKTKKVIALDALGVAPTGATPDFFHGKQLRYPPEYGPLAAVTPGTPGGLMAMEAEYGRLHLADVLAPAIAMADGYAVEAQLADLVERQKALLSTWPASAAVFLPHRGESGGGRAAPYAGEIFRQPDLAATLRKLVEAERQALAAGKDRKAAIYAAYDRFYKGDIAAELVRGTQEQGGLITRDDLARWQVRWEEPVSTSYKGIEVYKLSFWTQGPALLQALQILEPLDLRGMGLNSSRYIHTLYQTMSLAFADRDFYYGDPYFPPEEPTRGLLSRDYADARRRQIDWQHNDAKAGPGDPYPYQGGTNPYADLLAAWSSPRPTGPWTQPTAEMTHDEAFLAGTTSVVAADAEGWVVSMTPSGGWVPAFVAGKTGIGLSERMQSFVLDRAEGPFNVLEPGKRPRVTLTPSLALKDGKPYLAFAVQGGDSQDQNLLQFFLDVVEFGMNVQEAAEGPNINSYQMRSSFGEHESEPGRLLVQDGTPAWVRAELAHMGYKVESQERTSGPINAIMIDPRYGTFWGGSSNHGEDYGIAW